jgi:hypothetical protein
VVAEQAALIESLRAEVASLRRQAGRDSSNSSQPPSQDGPAAEARAKARAGSRRARPGRSQGGQKGHPGAGLAWVAQLDETRVIEPLACAAGLAGAPGRAAFSVQVFDIPPAALTVTEYQMMRRTCGCGHVTTAPPPPGVTGGPACYGPGVTDAATLLASTGPPPSTSAGSSTSASPAPATAPGHSHSASSCHRNTVSDGTLPGRNLSGGTIPGPPRSPSQATQQDFSALLVGPPGAVVGSGIMTRSWVARDRGAACERSLTGQVMPTRRLVLLAARRRAGRAWPAHDQVVLRCDGAKGTRLAVSRRGMTVGMVNLP